MIDLVIGSGTTRIARTVFDLLGTGENDITFSLGWAMSRSKPFLEGFLQTGLSGVDIGEVQQISLQASDSQLQQVEHGGYTDIQLESEKARVIIEAKRGWNLPRVEQLEKYIRRFEKGWGMAAIVVISECSKEFVASQNFPKDIAGTRVYYVSWRDIWEIAHKCRLFGTQAERRLATEISNYLAGLMTMQNFDSNIVYVVSIGGGKPDFCQWSWREIVQNNCYFCLYASKGWPKIPPNYLGFRYEGKLQNIHHVEEYKIVDGSGLQISKLIPQIDAKKWDKTNPEANKKHFVFKLGPGIVPSNDVKTGKIWGSGRVWAALDLLLTSKTISDARVKTKQRIDSELF